METDLFALMEAIRGAFLAPLTGAIDSWWMSANLNIELADNLTLVSITGCPVIEPAPSSSLSLALRSSRRECR